MPLSHPGDDDFRYTANPTPAKTVKACTVCGRVVMHSCYHDGRERSSIDMTKEQAKVLANRWLDALEKELRDFEAHIKRYLE